MAHFYRYSSRERRRRSLVQAYEATNSIADMPHVTFQEADTVDSTKASLERIKKQLAASGRFLLQGSLLKRSETLRKWNERWFTLDPTTGKFDYRIERGDTAPKGLINFDASSSILVSPINLQGSIKYDGCCIYIQTSSKKEYFLCAETPGAAQAWVSTLRAAQLVLKAHRDAVSSLSGNGTSALGIVAAAVAAANGTAKEAAKVLAAALQTSTGGALNSNSSEPADGVMDNLSIMKETLKVKDDELHQLAKDMRARDATIKELAARLSETAEAAEAAASAAHIMDNERKAVRSEIVKLRKELDEKNQLCSYELTSVKEKLSAAEKARDDALKESLLWQGELAKAREHAIIMEAALARAEESARQASAAKAKDSGREATLPLDAGQREVNTVDTLPKNGSQSEEAEAETPIAVAHSTHSSASEQLPGNDLSSMENGVEDLLLDLEFVEKAASFNKEKAAHGDIDGSAYKHNGSESSTDKALGTLDQETNLQSKVDDPS